MRLATISQAAAMKGWPGPAVAMNPFQAAKGTWWGGATQHDQAFTQVQPVFEWGIPTGGHVDIDTALLQH
jgi:hypothetical protein